MTRRLHRPLSAERWVKTLIQNLTLKEQHALFTTKRKYECERVIYYMQARDKQKKRAEETRSDVMLEWMNGGNTEPSTIAKSTYCPLRTLIMITKIFNVQLSLPLVLRQWDKAYQLASQEHLIWLLLLLNELGLSFREILLPLCQGATNCDANIPQLQAQHLQRLCFFSVAATSVCSEEGVFIPLTIFSRR